MRCHLNCTRNWSSTCKVIIAISILSIKYLHKNYRRWTRLFKNWTPPPPPKKKRRKENLQNKISKWKTCFKLTLNLDGSLVPEWEARPSWTHIGTLPPLTLDDWHICCNKTDLQRSSGHSSKLTIGEWTWSQKLLPLSVCKVSSTVCNKGEVDWDEKKPKHHIP